MILPTMFTNASGVVKIIWKHVLISFKHVPLWCLFFDPHPTSLVKLRVTMCKRSSCKCEKGLTHGFWHVATLLQVPLGWLGGPSKTAPLKDMGLSWSKGLTSTKTESWDHVSNSLHPLLPLVFFLFKDFTSHWLKNFKDSKLEPHTRNGQFFSSSSAPNVSNIHEAWGCGDARFCFTLAYKVMWRRLADSKNVMKDVRGTNSDTYRKWTSIYEWWVCRSSVDLWMDIKLIGLHVQILLTILD